MKGKGYGKGAILRGERLYYWKGRGVNEGKQLKCAGRWKTNMKLRGESFKGKGYDERDKKTKEK